MSKSAIIYGVLGGLAAGAVLGILFAPDKGSVTRRKISDQAGKLTDSLSDLVGNLNVTTEGVKNTGGRTKTERTTSNSYTGSNA